MKKEETAASVKRLGEIVEILKKEQLVRGLTPEKLRFILQDLGPTYVKLGQIMSMRSDMLPREYCAELEKLRTDAAPMSIEQVKAVIEESCGRSADELFSEFDETPLGSASMAQVHVARLKTGEKVAVKVQRQGIAETMEEDIRLMKQAAAMLKIAHIGGDVIDLHMVLDELWASAQQELNFLTEAENAAKFAELNEKEPDLACISTFSDYTTKQVLTMSYVGGCCVNELDKLKADGLDANAVGTALAENYIKQILDDGFFHADPHPGNIKICDGKIVFIDMGMMGSLSQRDRELFGRCVKAVSLNDIGGVKDAVLAIGEHKGKIDHTALYSDIEELFNRYMGADIGSMDIVKLLDEGMGLCRKNGISMPAGVTMLCRGIATIQGVIADLSPDVNLLQLVGKYVVGRKRSFSQLKNDAVSGARAAADSGRKLLDIPALASELMKELIRGRTKLNIEFGESEELKGTVERLVKELIYGIFAASLLLGSSLLCLTDMEPKILGIPAIGFIGYVLAFGAMLFLLILSGKNHRKKK